MPPLANDTWTRAARDADITLELPGCVPMFFRRIPAGSFLMGSRGHYPDEEPQHRVVISRDFFLGTFPVTQEQYRAVASSCPELRANPDPSHFKGKRRPVEQVSWDDACAFCARLRAWEGLPDGVAEVRLPTEAEWEYACRAGTDTEYYSGDGEAALGDVAWYGGNSGGQTHQVDERLETHPFGLYGTHGNVWEWCRDVYLVDAYRHRGDGVRDPVNIPGIYKTRIRISRGGSWRSNAGVCRCSVRFGDGHGERYERFGFRVCLVCDPASTVAADRINPEEEAR